MQVSAFYVLDVHSLALAAHSTMTSLVETGIISKRDMGEAVSALASPVK
jgi:hypothetical protein